MEKGEAMKAAIYAESASKTKKEKALAFRHGKATLENTFMSMNVL